MSDVREERLNALHAILEAFNSHDLDRIMTFFAKDAILRMPRGSEPWGTQLEGTDAVRSGLASRFSGLPDVHYADDCHFVDGDRGVSEWLLTGTTPDGIRIEVRGCDLWTFRDGLVICKDSYWKIIES